MMVMVFQYSVLLLIVFILEAGSGILTYLFEINVSFTLVITVVCSGCVAWSSEVVCLHAAPGI